MIETPKALIESQGFRRFLWYKSANKTTLSLRILDCMDTGLTL